jgi:hypothetical protein
VIAPPSSWEAVIATLNWRESMPLDEAARAVAAYKGWCQAFDAARPCGGCGREIYVPATLAQNLAAQFGRSASEREALHRALDIFAFAFLSYDTDSCAPEGPHLCHWCAWERDSD